MICSYQSVQYYTLFYWKDLSACIQNCHFHVICVTCLFDTCCAFFIRVHFSFSLCTKYVIKSFRALYVGDPGNGRNKLPFVFSVVTVEVVCWSRHDCVLMKSSPVKFCDDQHILI